MREVAIDPEDLALVIESGEAAVAEDGVDAAAVGDGGRGGVGVLGFPLAGRLTEDLTVPEGATGLGVEGEDAAGRVALGGGGQEEAAVGDDGGRPGFAGDGGFPEDVLGGGPGGGDAGFGGNALAAGAAEARPVFRGERAAEEGEDPVPHLSASDPVGDGDGVAEAIPIGVARHSAIGTENELPRSALHDPFDLVLDLFGCSGGEDAMPIHAAHVGAFEEFGDLLRGELPVSEFGVAVDDLSGVIENGIVVGVGRDVIAHVKDVEGASRADFLHGDEVGRASRNR